LFKTYPSESAHFCNREAFFKVPVFSLFHAQGEYLNQQRQVGVHFEYSDDQRIFNHLKIKIFDVKPLLCWRSDTAPG